MAVRVQRGDFDAGAELAALSAGNPAVGGVAAFVGLVRDMAGGAAVAAMTLEHYPGMTEKQLAAAIALSARRAQKLRRRASRPQTRARRADG